MTTCGLVVVCVVRPFTAELAVDVAWEVPIQVKDRPSNRIIGSLCDNPKAPLVNILEHKGSVVSTQTPARVFKWVRGTVEHSTGLGMEEVGEVIVVAMDYDGTLADEGITNIPTMETVRWLPTNALGESKCEETDASHEEQDKADKPHLFPPCSLSFGAPEALRKRLISLMSNEFVHITNIPQVFRRKGGKHAVSIEQ